jgi:hypothetical protein
MGVGPESALSSEAAGDDRPPSRLAQALAKGEILDLQEMTRPLRRAGMLVSHRLVLGGRMLGEVCETGRGLMAFDDARAVWVGPYKRLIDLARFFLPDDPGEPRPQPVVVGIPTTKGRTFWSMRVDLVKKDKGD